MARSCPLETFNICYDDCAVFDAKLKQCAVLSQAQSTNDLALAVNRIADLMAGESLVGGSVPSEIVEHTLPPKRKSPDNKTATSSIISAAQWVAAAASKLNEHGNFYITTMHDGLSIMTAGKELFDSIELPMTETPWDYDNIFVSRQTKTLDDIEFVRLVPRDADL